MKIYPSLYPHLIADFIINLASVNFMFILIQPCIVVKQLTLDIEHYLGETVKTTAEWGHRYLAFTDYDVQILEVRTTPIV